MKFHFYNKSFVWIVDPDCIGETSLIRCLRNTNNCASWANFVFWDLVLNRTTMKKQNLLMVTSYIRPYSNRSNTIFFLQFIKYFCSRMIGLNASSDRICSFPRKTDVKLSPFLIKRLESRLRQWRSWACVKWKTYFGCK